MRLLLAAAVALFAAGPALADADVDVPLAPLTTAHWSVATGETVSPSHDALSFELGWPGVGVGYLHGLSDRADMGVKFDLLYGDEGTNNTRVGMGLRVPLRLVTHRRDKLSIELHIEPGLRFYGSRDFEGSKFVIGFPVGAMLGIQATPELRLAAAFDLTMGLVTTQGVHFEVGPQFGFAAEYFVDKQLLVGVDTRFGPLFFSGTTDALFAFRTQIVLGYRL